MIYLLKEYIEKDTCDIDKVKEELIDLYSQLSICNTISNDDFLEIVKNNTIFVEVQNKHIIGAITVLLERKIIHSGKHVAHIEDVVVNKQHRGKQIGKQLLLWACEYAKQQNCYKVILNCDDRIRVFYEKCGFKAKNIEMSLYFD